jgi:hypothetical protein
VRSDGNLVFLAEERVVNRDLHRSNTWGAGSSAHRNPNDSIRLNFECLDVENSDKMSTAPEGLPACEHLDRTSSARRDPNRLLGSAPDKRVSYSCQREPSYQTRAFIP